MQFQWIKFVQAVIYFDNYKYPVVLEIYGLSGFRYI